MKIEMDARVAEQYDNVQVGVLIIKQTTNEYKGNEEQLDQLLAEQEQKIIDDFQGTQVQEKEEIKVWRNVYRQFGAKASKFHCSIENLIRMIISDNNEHHIRRINPIVDIYNAISLKYRLPVGGDNLDAISEYIKLTIADGTESFYVLHGSEAELVKENEVIYRDSQEVLCRRWNWRECEKTKISEDTKNICLFVEQVGLLQEEEVMVILKDMASLISKYCGGTFEMTVLNKNRLSTVVECI